MSTNQIDATGAAAPVAKRVETRRIHHDDEFVDHYEWMRDKSDPEVIAHLEAENAHVEEVTAYQEPLRQRIFEEIKSRTKETDLSVPLRRDGWWYYGRSFEGKQYARALPVPDRRTRRLGPAGLRRAHRHPGRADPARREHRSRRPRLSSRSAPAVSARTATSSPIRSTSRATSDTPCSSRTYAPVSTTRTASPASAWVSPGPRTAPPSTTPPSTRPGVPTRSGAITWAWRVPPNRSSPSLTNDSGWPSAAPGATPTW